MVMKCDYCEDPNLWCCEHERDKIVKAIAGGYALDQLEQSISENPYLEKARLVAVARRGDEVVANLSLQGQVTETKITINIGAKS